MSTKAPNIVDIPSAPYRAPNIVPMEWNAPRFPSVSGIVLSIPLSEMKATLGNRTEFSVMRFRQILQ